MSRQEGSGTKVSGGSVRISIRPRPFTDLELGGRVDDVSDACSCMDGL